MLLLASVLIASALIDGQSEGGGSVTMWNPSNPGSPFDPNRADGLEAHAREVGDTAKRATNSEEHADLERYFTRHDRWAWRHRFWLAGGGFALVAAAIIIAGALVDPGRPPRSAEELLALANKPPSDATAPITTLHAEQTLRQYFLGPGLEGRVALELKRRYWYQAPNRQRIEDEATFLHRRRDGGVSPHEHVRLGWLGSMGPRRRQTPRGRRARSRLRPLAVQFRAGSGDGAPRAGSDAGADLVRPRDAGTSGPRGRSARACRRELAAGVRVSAARD